MKRFLNRSRCGIVAKGRPQIVNTIGRKTLSMIRNISTDSTKRVPALCGIESL